MADDPIRFTPSLTACADAAMENIPQGRRSGRAEDAAARCRKSLEEVPRRRMLSPEELRSDANFAPAIAFLAEERFDIA